MGRRSSVAPLPVSGEQDPEPVVGELSEAVGQPTDLFDDEVDGLGAAVGDAFGVEVGQHLGPPGAERATEPGDLGNGQLEKLSSTLTAISRPLAGVAW